jgi:Leucine-rich repeat (LRR) protein
MFDMGGVGASAFDPSWVEALPEALQIVNCAHNMLSALPDGLARLSKLLQLFASGNQIQDYPASLCNFQFIKELQVGAHTPTP